MTTMHASRRVGHRHYAVGALRGNLVFVLRVLVVAPWCSVHNSWPSHAWGRIHVVLGPVVVTGTGDSVDNPLSGARAGRVPWGEVGGHRCTATRSAVHVVSFSPGRGVRAQRVHILLRRVLWVNHTEAEGDPRERAVGGGRTVDDTPPSGPDLWTAPGVSPGMWPLADTHNFVHRLWRMGTRRRPGESSERSREGRVLRTGGENPVDNWGMPKSPSVLRQCKTPGYSGSEALPVSRPAA